MFTCYDYINFMQSQQVNKEQFLSRYVGTEEKTVRCNLYSQSN
jgi:hypothetical protein